MRRFAVDFVTTSAKIAELNKDELTGPMSETTLALFALCLYLTRASTWHPAEGQAQSQHC